MLLTMFSWNILGLNIPIVQSLTAVRSLNNVPDQVHPWQLCSLLVMDIANRVMRHATLPESSEFLLMPWPPNSPDINPIACETFSSVVQLNL